MFLLGVPGMRPADRLLSGVLLDLAGAITLDARVRGGSGWRARRAALGNGLVWPGRRLRVAFAVWAWCWHGVVLSGCFFGGVGHAADRFRSGLLLSRWSYP